MLETVAPGVLVATSEWSLMTSTVVVTAPGRAVLIDPGALPAELDALADDLAARGLEVVAGVVTHPHFDHLLWSDRFGDVARYAARGCVERVGSAWAEIRGEAQVELPEVAPHLRSGLRPLSPAEHVLPVRGRSLRVITHDGHSPGHLGIWIADAAVLVAGDMLSDVEVPLLDLETGPEDPLEDYWRGLSLLRSLATDAEVLVPGHGRVALGSAEIAGRFAEDRGYLDALVAGAGWDDRRLVPGAGYGEEWLATADQRQREAVDPGVSPG